MIAVIIGGSGSGKSEFAENLAVKLRKEDSLIYIATMLPFGEEGKERVKKHRLQREKKQFETIECYTNIENLKFPKQSTVLLECMSNLVANEMYEPDGAGEAAEKVIKNGIKKLAGKTNNLIIVSNNVFEDGVSYGMEMKRYMENMGSINQYLVGQSDYAVEIVYGIKIPLKCEKNF